MKTSLKVSMKVDLRADGQRRSENWQRRQEHGLLGLVNNTFISVTTPIKLELPKLIPFHMNEGLFTATDSYPGIDYNAVIVGAPGFDEGLKYSFGNVDRSMLPEMEDHYWIKLPSVIQGKDYTHHPTRAFKELLNCFVPEKDGELSHKSVIGKIDKAVDVLQITRERVKRNWDLKGNGKGGYNFTPRHPEYSHLLFSFSEFLWAITVSLR